MGQYVTIEKQDVGKNMLHIFGELRDLTDTLGYVQNQDIGKRIYFFGDDKPLQVENQEQFEKRTVLMRGRQLK